MAELALMEVAVVDEVAGSDVDDLSLDEVRALIGRLRRAISSHEAVGQGVGVLVATYRMSPEQAWSILRSTSQRTNTKVAALARAIVELAADLPATDPAVHATVVSDLLPKRESVQARRRQIDGHPSPSTVASPFSTKTMNPASRSS